MKKYTLPEELYSGAGQAWAAVSPDGSVLDAVYKHSFKNGATEEESFANFISHMAGAYKQLMEQGRMVSGIMEDGSFVELSAEEHDSLVREPGDNIVEWEREALDTVFEDLPGFFAQAFELSVEQDDEGFYGVLYEDGEPVIEGSNRSNPEEAELALFDTLSERVSELVKEAYRERDPDRLDYVSELITAMADYLDFEEDDSEGSAV